ncbi:3-dehydroquinate synthase II [Amycolatopsis ultiminotia]|uniref:3-dehydroquinate synthase II n=1 Tax=Amycolatopsis ultiminotia TaxID=543629 RepID=A0ABP6X8R8_9PSEU
MRSVWLDIDDAAGAKRAILEEAVHQRVAAVVTSTVADLDGLPPTVQRVLRVDSAEQAAEHAAAVDVLLVDPQKVDCGELRARHPDVSLAVYVEVADHDTLEQACRLARTEQRTVIYFRDPTKIPLEIVLAAAHGAKGSIVTVAADIEEAGIIFGVLEHGSDGVLLAAGKVGDATELQRIATSGTDNLTLEELTVTKVTHVGMGDRACVDTSSYLRKNEGILVGSYSKALILCVSETHPLPYMPTRPFRVNAGAIMSYTHVGNGRTSYLSELRAGSKVLAVDTDGNTREVVVGRVKIESRPLISVDAVSASGVEVNLLLQDDWHVRVLGPGAAVLNSTELKPGDAVLGHLPTADRHVGYPIDEFCVEV